jgi:predicted DNA-binding protein
MSTMVRKQVYLERRQDRALKRLARKAGKTEAEIIREALDRLVRDTERENERRKAWEESRAFVRQWIAKGPAPGGERTWKREDLYERGSSGGH